MQEPPELMATGFTGSRALDERRRRRLASEQDAQQQSSTESDNSQETAGPLDSEQLSQGFPEYQEQLRPRVPQVTLTLNKFLSPRPWKISVVCLLLLLAASSIIAGLWLSDTLLVNEPGQRATMLSRLIQTIQQAAAVSLITVAGQLCLIVWYGRSRSSSDFEGRYRIWLWVSLACFLWAFVSLSKVHQLSVELFATIWPLQWTFWNQQQLFWMIPVCIWGMVLMAQVHLDMKRCWYSRACLWLGMICQSAVLTLELLPAAILQAELWTASLFLGGCTLMVCSLVMHARFVLYNSPEPPDRKPKKVKQKKVKPIKEKAKKASKTVSEQKATADKKAIKIDSEESIEEEATTTSTKKATAKKSTPKKTTRKKSSASSTSRKTKKKTTTAKKKGTVSSKETATPETPAPQKPAPKPTVEKTVAKVEDQKPAPVAKSPSAEKNEKSTSSTEDQADQPVSKTTTKSPSKTDSKTEKKWTRVDGPDPEMLKGLSKRERRNLRKKFKEQQRAEQEGY